MDIEVIAGMPFIAVATGAPAGLVGIIGVQILNEDQTVHTARTTAGVTFLNNAYSVTLTAPATDDDYLLRWDTGGLSPVIADDTLIVRSIARPQWRPTDEDLASLIPSRAAGRFTGGGAVGSPPAFPDVQRVNDVIDDATAIVWVAVGGAHLPAKFWPAARAIAKLAAALELEPSAWPEQARPDKSAWDQWEKLYDKHLAALIKAIANDAVDGDDGDGGPESGGSGMPVYSFPGACRDHIPGSELPWPSGAC